MAQSIYSPMRIRPFTYRNCYTLLYLHKGYLDKQKMKSIITATLKKIIPTSLGILFLIVMSQVLKGSGIMQLIAQGVTQLTGKYYSFAVPFLGLLGLL